MLITFIYIADKAELLIRFMQGTFASKVFDLIISKRNNTIIQFEPTIEDSYRKTVEIDGQTYILDIMNTANQVCSSLFLLLLFGQIVLRRSIVHYKINMYVLLYNLFYLRFFQMSTADVCFF